MSDKYRCDECTKDYNSKMGLWHHNKKFHIIPELEKKKNVTCSHCNKELSCKQSKWRHEQKCKLSNKISLEEKFNQLSDKVSVLEKKPQNIINNTTNNIQFVVNAHGKEDILKLPLNVSKEIMSKRLNCLTHMAEKLNFNADIPENHSYCVTAINDKHASVINPETNSIIKTDKFTLFDQLLTSYFEKLDQITENKLIKKDEREEYASTVKKLKELLFQNKKYMKRYYSELNYISYNNKDLVQKTWSLLKQNQQFIDNQIVQDDFGEILEDSDTENSEDEKIKQTQEKLKNIFNFNNKIPMKSRLINISESESELDTDSDTEEEIPDVINIEITIKNKPYVVKGSNVYDKTSGEFYGTYVNGKVKRKIKQTDIDV